MFGFFKMTKIVTVSDAESRNHIQEVLTANGIKFHTKMKDASARNACDTARMGRCGNLQLKYQYSFYVDKEQKEQALFLLRNVR